jgi:hypothetical protein
MTRLRDGRKNNMTLTTIKYLFKVNNTLVAILDDYDVSLTAYQKALVDNKLTSVCLEQTQLLQYNTIHEHELAQYTPNTYIERPSTLPWTPKPKTTGGPFND